MNLITMDRAGVQTGRGAPFETPAQTGAVWKLFEEHLSQIPSVYGRLSYLASLSDEHYGLRLLLGEVEMRCGLRRCHAKAFGEWLCMSLAQQKADLDLYFAEMSGHRRQNVADWLRQAASLERMVPAGATQAEKALWASNWGLLAHLLRAEYSPASEVGTVNAAEAAGAFKA